MKPDPKPTSAIEAPTSADFMAGVAWTCAFLRRIDALNKTDTQHACAMHREGRPQAQLVPELMAALLAHPHLVLGANAVLTEYLTSAGEHGAGTMNLDAYASMTLEDFTRENDPEQCSNVVPFRRAMAAENPTGATKSRPVTIVEAEVVYE